MNQKDLQRNERPASHIEGGNLHIKRGLFQHSIPYAFADSYLLK